jgi:ATP adenylyltransferase
MRTCQLCPGGSAKPWNLPLVESANFRVLVSLGALVEGWLLLVPNEHFLSMGALPASLIPEMRMLKELVCDRLERIYGAISAFEHGPGSERRNVGCGVDHAHLHIVPVGFDLAAAAAAHLPRNSRWEVADLPRCQSAARAGDDYIYLEQPINYGRILRHKDLASQTMRRAIAAEIGKPNDFNWRSNPQIENVNRTIRHLKSEMRRAMPAQHDASEHAA